ncbi:MAG: anthrone oxygenase family protein, partial [Flavitalea sp.]
TGQIFRWASAASFIAAVIFTIAFNVPINLATAKWTAENPPVDWKQKRNRWEFFQGVRSWLLLIGFGLLCVAVTLHDV